MKYNALQGPNDPRVAPNALLNYFIINNHIGSKYLYTLYREKNPSF